MVRGDDGEWSEARFYEVRGALRQAQGPESRGPVK